jgi:peptide-methionine (S)-S-oxide reductase
LISAQKAIFAAGCFWGVEHAFRQMPGVLDVMPGYIGGEKDKPTYKDVCSGNTGHAEAVEIVFDPNLLSYETLLEKFWSLHDPTQRNRQGPDIGAQYRSAIFYQDEAQKAAAQKSMRALQARLPRPIATEIAPAPTFWPAEEYHRRYIEKHGGACHI